MAVTSMGDSVVCLTRYGLASVMYTAVMAILAYLLAVTGSYAVAIAIPAITIAFYLIATRIRPQDDYVGDIIFSIGCLAAAIAYMPLILKSEGLKAYFYYVMFLITILAYVAVFRRTNS
jgi:hypothetical protein